MASSRFSLHRPTVEEWDRVRDIRVRAIADAPIAFLESAAEARSRTEDEWRARILRNREDGNVQVVARDAVGTWVGTMTGFVSIGPPTYAGPRPGPATEPRANLVAVWVDPGWRGREVGVADALFAAIGAWARDERGLAALWLDVHADNPRAIAFYRRHGFRASGVEIPDPRNADDREIEMVRDLVAPLEDGAPT